MINKTALLALIPAFITIASCSRGIRESHIIFTIAEGELKEGTAKQQFRLAIIDTLKKRGKMKIISGNFFSARFPAVSFDGKFLAFSGRKTADDPWQIYIMYLRNKKTRRITVNDSSCTNPVWLPDGKIVYKGGKSLFRIDPAERIPEKITFDPYSYSYPSILNDGRLVTSRAKGNEASGNLFVLRPDGTKVSLFFNSDPAIISNIRETPGGRLFFIHSNKNEDKTEIASVEYRNPFTTLQDVSGKTEGQFRDVFPISEKKLLVSWRNSNEEKYSLREFNTITKEFSRVIYEDQYFNAIEPVMMVTSIPKKLPSEVDKEVKTGLIMCQNINFPTDRKVSSIRIFGIDSTLGEAKVSNDGSFYLKIIADTPFRISAVDSTGNMIGIPCKWIYLRPNERRGCVGCHENPMLSPENRQPVAVRYLPVNIPNSDRKSKEKITELE